MNKLAVLALTLLLFLSAMSWYLAKGSVNDYLKSQVILQGQYYSGQQTNIARSIFSAEKNNAIFSSLTLANIDGYTQVNALTIDEIKANLISPTDNSQPQQLNDGLRTSQIVTLAKLTLKTVTINMEKRSDNKNNITELIERVTLQLAKDYPALYPKLAAKIYAEQNPDLNAELNNEVHVQPILVAKPIKETNKAVLASKANKQQKKLLGKAKTRIAIQLIEVNKLVIHITENKQSHTTEFKNINLGSIGGVNGLASNQIGGEVLRLLLQKAQVVSE